MQWLSQKSLPRTRGAAEGRQFVDFNPMKLRPGLSQVSVFATPGQAFAMPIASL